MGGRRTNVNLQRCPVCGGYEPDSTPCSAGCDIEYQAARQPTKSPLPAGTLHILFRDPEDGLMHLFRCAACDRTFRLWLDEWSADAEVASERPLCGRCLETLKYDHQDLLNPDPEARVCREGWSTFQHFAIPRDRAAAIAALNARRGPGHP